MEIIPTRKEKRMKKAIVKYGDEVTPFSGKYSWWSISYGERQFRCSVLSDAEWLKDVLDALQPVSEHFNQYGNTPKPE